MPINFKKRCLISATMGTAFGILCFSGFSSNPNMPAEFMEAQKWSLSNPMMWSLIANRFAIGFTVGLAGFMTVHPLFGFKLPPLLRGIQIGIIISLSMALGALMGPDTELARQAFWITLLFGAIIGAIIDLTATKFAGQGDTLKN